MTYPTYGQIYGSKFEPVNGIVTTVALNGTIQSLDNYGAKIIGRYTLVHLLTSAERTSLLSDYDTNRGTTFNFTWQEDSTTHLVFYAGPPQVRKVSGSYYQVTVELEEVVTLSLRLLENNDVRLLENGDRRLLEGGS